MVRWDCSSFFDLSDFLVKKVLDILSSPTSRLVTGVLTSPSVILVPQDSTGDTLGHGLVLLDSTLTTELP